MAKLSSITLPNDVTYDLKDSDAIKLGITNAHVGDVIQISAVDGNGSPTEWTIGDFSNSISFYIDTNGHLIEVVGSEEIFNFNFYILDGHLYYE